MESDCQASGLGRCLGLVEEGEKFGVLHRCGPHRIDIGHHLLGHVFEEAGDRFRQRVDMVAKVIGSDHCRINTNVRREACDRHVFNALRTQNFV